MPDLFARLAADAVQHPDQLSTMTHVGLALIAIGLIPTIYLTVLAARSLCRRLNTRAGRYLDDRYFNAAATYRFTAISPAQLHTLARQYEQGQS